MARNAAASLAPGTVLGATYEIVRLVGMGGMGELYEARHLRLAGRYAIKILHAGIAGLPDVVARFQREADITSRLRHPNIVNIVDFNLMPDGRPFLAMEFLEGTELSVELARAGPMPLARVVDLVGQLATALGAAHAIGVVHRDLKPQNVFLVQLPHEEREVIKILDFGISKLLESNQKLTVDAAILGTPQYMAPEQALGRIGEIDERTDQFALALMTYEMLAGHPAFRAEVPTAVLYQVVHEPPPSLRASNPEVPPAVETVVLRGLAKHRATRYPSVREFHRALLAAAGFATGTGSRPLLPPATTSSAGQTKLLSTEMAQLASARKATSTFGAAAAELIARPTPPPTAPSRLRPVLIAAVAALVVGGLFALRVSGLGQAAAPHPAAAPPIAPERAPVAPPPSPLPPALVVTPAVPEPPAAPAGPPPVPARASVVKAAARPVPESAAVKDKRKAKVLLDLEDPAPAEPPPPPRPKIITDI